MSRGGPPPRPRLILTSGARGSAGPGVGAPDLRDSGALTSRALTFGPPVAPQFSPLNDGTARRPQSRGG